MNKQILSLTATRGFAAILVVVFHFGADFFPFSKLPAIFSNGNIAVSYFYVLSGFVLYISYAHSSLRYWTYFKKRLGRIAPVYIIALAFSVYKVPLTDDLVWQTSYSFFFLQAWIPKYALALNTAGWSVSVELFFYVLFPLLLLFQKKWTKLFACIAALIFLTTQVVFHAYFKNDFRLTDNYCFFMYNPVLHISQFLVGMIGGFLFSNIRFSKKLHPTIPLLLLFTILCGIAFRPAGLFFHAGLLAPLFVLLITAVALADPAFLRLRPLVFFGEISYGIYILQFPVYNFMRALNETDFHLSPQNFFWCSLVVLCAVAAITYYAVEKPVRKLITRLSHADAAMA